MSRADDEPAGECFSLVDSLTHEWIKIPRAAMADVGPAAQTLGGILKITNRETFTNHKEIAWRARLPVATVRKHLVTLCDQGWIQNNGRGHTRAGRPRRTCTISVASRTRDAMTEYAVLPWWACCHIRHVGRLPWSSRAVLSIIMARLMALRATVDQQDGDGMDADDVIGSIDKLGGDDRFRFPLAKELSRIGLSRDSVITAKRALQRYGIIHIVESERGDGGTPCDLLVPNCEFQLVVTPASKTGVWVDFRVGRKLVRGGSKIGKGGGSKTGN